MKKMITATAVAAVCLSFNAMAQTTTPWRIAGNNLTATGKLGTTSNQDVQFISNNVVNGLLHKTGRWGFGLSTLPSAKVQINSAVGEDAFRVQVGGNTKLVLAANGGLTVGANIINPPAAGLFVQGFTGIGTSTPLSKLHVQLGSSGASPFSLSTITAENSTSNYISILSPVANETGILFGHNLNSLSGGIIYNNPSAKNGLQFRTNGNITRMTLTSDGKLNVGSAADPSIYRLRVDQGSGFGFDIANPSSGTDWEFFAGSAGLSLFVDGGAGGAKGQFNRSTGVYSSFSDARGKTNIKPMANVLDKISLLKPSSYQFKNTKDQQEYDGFIAQEVMKVFPNLVTHNVEAKRNVDQYLLNYDGFGVIAVKAIQELVQVIKEQEERIAKLEQAGASISSGAAENSISKIPSVAGASLEQNQPNPFNNVTTIRYQIPQGSKAQLQIFNASGALVKTFTANESGQAVINAGELSAGTYTYNLVVNGKATASKKMVIVK